MPYLLCHLTSDSIVAWDISRFFLLKMCKKKKKICLNLKNISYKKKKFKEIIK